MLHFTLECGDNFQYSTYVVSNHYGAIILLETKQIIIKAKSVHNIFREGEWLTAYTSVQCIAFSTTLNTSSGVNNLLVNIDKWLH